MISAILDDRDLVVQKNVHLTLRLDLFDTLYNFIGQRDLELHFRSTI